MSVSQGVRGKPVTPSIKFGDDGAPYIEALRCEACRAVTTTACLACPACAARDGLRPFRASEQGRLHAYSIVHRSFPGVATPFVSAIVDLEDGVVLKAVLRDVEPTPEALAFGMPVRVRFDDALGRRDIEGAAYVSYFFSPEGAQ